MLNLKKIVLLILTFGSFLIFWVTTVIFYTPACFNLKIMIEDIDKKGELTIKKAPLSWYLTNFHTLESWIIRLPKSTKYLKYEIVTKTKKIRLYRRIMAFTSPIMIIFGFILFMTVD